MNRGTRRAGRPSRTPGRTLLYCGSRRAVRRRPPYRGRHGGIRRSRPDGCPCRTCGRRRRHRRIVGHRPDPTSQIVGRPDRRPGGYRPGDRCRRSGRLLDPAIASRTRNLRRRAGTGRGGRHDRVVRRPGSRAPPRGDRLLHGNRTRGHRCGGDRPSRCPHGRSGRGCRGPGCPGPGCRGHGRSAPGPRVHRRRGRDRPRSARPAVPTPRGLRPGRPSGQVCPSGSGRRRDRRVADGYRRNHPRYSYAQGTSPTSIGPTGSSAPRRARCAGRPGPMQFCGQQKTPRRCRRGVSFSLLNVGGDLLSHTLTSAVPSALEGLASGFGMGPGVPHSATTTDNTIRLSTYRTHPPHPG